MAFKFRTRILTALSAALLLAVFWAGGPVRQAAASVTDTDLDGLPDAWETQYFGNLAQTDIGDPDGDSYTNLAEYNNGTNPAVAETIPPYLSTVEWTAVGPGGGGAQYNPAIAPNNPDLMYGFCDMGGIYRSKDGGHTWQMYTFDQAQMPAAYDPVHCNPQFDPFDENICFIGVGGGLKRTTDGGDTWEWVVSGASATAIAIDRAHTDIVLYGDNLGHLFLSSDGGTTFNEVSSWYSDVGQVIADLFVDASSQESSLTVYASTEYGGLFKTTDGGTTWTSADGGLPPGGISDFNAGMKVNQAVLFAAVWDYGVYRSVNGGSTWSLKSTGIDVPAAGHMELGICDSNPDVLYVGSQENSGPTVYKTTDGGDSWALVLTDPSAPNFPAGVTVARDWMTLALGWGWGEEPHEIEVSPTDPDYVAFSEDGRTWRSDDGGASWFCCNDKEASAGSNRWTSAGFETTTNYRLLFAPWDHDKAYITYTDIGFFRSQDRAVSWRPAWTSATGGSVQYKNTFYDVAFDPTTSGKMWAVSSNNHDLPHEKMLRQSGFATFTGAILRSTDSGATWTNLGHPIGANNGAITSIIVDPTSAAGSRTLYCAIMGHGVYKSTNDGVSWTAANNGLGMPSNMNAWMLRRMPDGTLYCALTEAMSGSARYPGALFKSTDGAGTWTKVNTGQELPYIYGFDVDPTDQDKIYVASFQKAGSGGEGLWRTTNGGTTWTKTLGGCDMSGADIDPELHTRVYAAMEQGENFWPAGGFYISEDSGATWTKIPGLPFERCGPNYTTFDPDDSEKIFVTTFGGGVWRATVPHAAAPSAQFTPTPSLGQFPLLVSFDSSASTGSITTYTWDFGDGTRSHLANPTHTFAGAGTYTVTLKVEGLNGTDATTGEVDAINVDSDGDGLPDFWEIDFFGNLDQGAGDDPDGDGFTNLQEYESGTDPTQSDATPPAVSSLAVIPTEVRVGIDRTMTLTGIADDRTAGNSNVKQAEYFVDVLGAAGSGTAMSAADGAFDSPYEALTGTLNTSLWTIGTKTLYVRAKDASGFWSDAEQITVDVVDGTPPAAVTTLSAAPALKFEKIHSEAWETAGTVLAEEETLTIDLGSAKTVGAVSMRPTAATKLFPSSFTISGSPDNDEWTVLAMGFGYKAPKGASLWMSEPADYRYIKVTATGKWNSTDKHYYVKAAEVAVYETTTSNRVRATWVATADDGNTASSGPASEYDLRFSGSRISGDNFDAATEVTSGVGAPGARGTVEAAEFSIGDLSGAMYVALKVGDEVPNWSGISNVAQAAVGITGLKPLTPDDAIELTPDPTMQFTYTVGVDVQTSRIAMSDRPDFPAGIVKNPDGTQSRTLKFSLKPGQLWWKPVPGQWKAIKGLASNNGAIYWRLEGRNPAYTAIFGAMRAIIFEPGTITVADPGVTNATVDDGKEKLAPVLTAPPIFGWTNNHSQYFFIDVSTDASVPLSNPATVTLSKGVSGGPYRASAAEWKKIRKLATASAGRLYWRVRGLDRDKVFVSASDVQEFYVDGGTWIVDAIDMSEPFPICHWTHTGAGLVRFAVEFSADNSFGAVARMPLVTTDTFQMSAAQKAAVSGFAQKAGVTSLYYRIKGIDADNSFVTYSDASTVDMP